MSKIGETVAGWVTAVVVLGFIGWSIDSVQNFIKGTNTPKILEIDGQSVVACGGVSISSDGGMLVGDTFQVSYTDANGVKHVYRGVRKVRLSVRVPPPNSRANIGPG